MSEMFEVLHEFAATQTSQGDEPFDVTVLLSTGETVTGLIEGVHDDGVLTMRRLVDRDTYAELLRHYAISAVIGAYFTEES